MGAHPRQIAGLAVCEGCIGAPYLPTRLKASGIHLGYSYRADESVVEIGQENPYDRRQHVLTVLAEAPNPSGMHIRLQYEGFSAKMAKLLNEEIQIGNSEFDDLVWIRTSTPEETKGFLSLSGVQAAIMELIRAEASIDIDLAKVYVKAEKRGPLDGRQIALFTAALAHHLAKFA